MFAEIKRLSKHISIYGLSNIISRSISFILLPIHTHLLDSTVDYGIAIIIFAYIGFVNVIYLHGMDTAFLRYYILKEEGFTKKTVFSTAFLSISILSVILSSIIYFSADFISWLCFSSAENAHIIKWTAGILFFDALAFLPFLVLRAEERSVRFMILKIFNVTITIGLNVYFVLKYGVEGIFIANLIASAATFFMVLPIAFARLTKDISQKIYSELLKFGLPYILPGLSIISMDLIDRFIIQRFYGESLAGVYGAGYRMAMAMALAVAAFRFAWHPFFLSIAEKENAHSVYARVLSYFVLAAGWIYLAISYFIQDIIALQMPFMNKNLIRQEYWDGVSIVPVVMIAYIFYGIYVNFIVGIYIKKQSKYLPLVTGISAVINIVLNYLLIPVYGMMGAAIATLAAYAAMACILLLVTQRFYPVKYEYGRLLHLVVVIGGLFMIPEYVLNLSVFQSALPGYFSALMKAGLLIAYPFVLLISGFFTADEKRRITSILSKKPY